jgi:AbrB family looped-hinge helix DNA binding protein
MLYFAGMTHRIGAKGQVVIPKKLRDTAHLPPGTEVEFALEGDGVLLLPRAKRRALGGRFADSGMAQRLLADRATERR